MHSWKTRISVTIKFTGKACWLHSIQTSVICSLQICVCAADILKVASEVLDLIMGPLESFLEEAFKPIEKTLSSLLPCKNYVKYLVSDIEYLVARRVTLVIAFHFLPPNLGQLMATYECYFVIEWIQVEWWGHSNPTCCNRMFWTCCTQTVGMLKHLRWTSS